MKLIPAIDIIDGKLVRLFKGDYDQKTEYDRSPYDMARYYQDLGLTHIHVVDLNGAVDGKLTNLAVIEEIARIDGLFVQVGGGVRSIEHIDTLVNHGVDVVIIGSLLVNNFDMGIQLVHSFPKKVIAGLDILNNFLASHGWKETSTINIHDFIQQLNLHPFHSIVSTDISKDGTFSGLNLDLYRSIAALSNHSIVASGGVKSIQDLVDLRDLNLDNVSACIVGKAIIEGRITERDVSEFL